MANIYPRGKVESFSKTYAKIVARDSHGVGRLARNAGPLRPQKQKDFENRIAALFDQVEKDAEAEAKSEKVIDRAIYQLALFLYGSKEEELKGKLADVHCIKTNKEALQFLKTMSLPLHKIDRLITKALEHDQQALSHLAELQRVLAISTVPKVEYFRDLTTQRYGEIRERDSLARALQNMQASAQRMIGIIGKSKSELKKFDYEAFKKDLEYERQTLLEIVKQNIRLYGVEVALLEHDDLADMVGVYLKKQYNPKVSSGIKRIKRTRRLELAAKWISIAAIMHQGAFSSLLGLFFTYGNQVGMRMDPFGVTRQSALVEFVKFKSDLGYKLGGRLFNHQTSDVTIIMCEGTGQSMDHMTPFAKVLNQNYNVFCFDFGWSEEGDGTIAISMGKRETEDLRGAIKFLQSIGKEKIVLWGMSQGAIAALRVAADPQGANIMAVQVVNPLSDLENVIEETGKKLRLTPPARYWIKKIMTGLGEYEMKDASVVNEMHKIQCPVLVVPGEQDRLMPPKQAQLIAQHAPNVTVRPHSKSHSVLMADPVEIGKISIEFLNQHSFHTSGSEMQLANLHQ